MDWGIVGCHRRGGLHLGRRRVVDPGRAPPARGCLSRRSRPGGIVADSRVGARPFGAGPGAGSPQSRGRRQRAPAVGGAGRRRLMTMTRTGSLSPRPRGSRTGRPGDRGGRGRRRGPRLRRPLLGSSERPAATISARAQGSDRAGQPGAVAGLATALAPRPVGGRGGDLGNRPAGAVDPAERAAVLEEFYGLGLRRLCFVFDDLVKMSDPTSARPSTKRTSRPGRWRWPARPRRCGPRCWGRFPPRRRTGCGNIWTTSARSGSPTPRRPSSRSPSGCDACMTAAASACRNPTGARKSSSSLSDCWLGSDADAQGPNRLKAGLIAQLAHVVVMALEPDRPSRRGKRALPASR